MIEIFLRTAVKAVGRFRCLSKSWNSKLSSSQFVRRHLKRTINHQNLLLIRPSDNSLHVVDAPIANGTISREIEFGFTWNFVLASCNTLVLLTNTERELFLVNPSTLQHVKLPPTPSELKSYRHSYSLYGVGYDNVNDDYKVLGLTYCWLGLRRFDRLVDVYSVKSGAWESVASAEVCCSADHVGAAVNGAIHVHSETDSGYVIEALDLADGVFRVIPAPPNAGRRCYNVLVLEGCLCVVNKILDTNIDIWMMKQYGIAASWTKYSIAADGRWEICRPICFIGDREIVFLTFTATLVMFNLIERTRELFIVDGVPAAYREGVAFVDNLVSPNKLLLVEEEKDEE